MRIDKYNIAKDGETVRVELVGINQKTGEETLKALGYTRDFLGGLEMVKRKMSVEACEKENLNDAIRTIEEQDKELKKMIKKNCKECLSGGKNE